LAIEVAGAIHFEEGQLEKDRLRQIRLVSLGVHVKRFSDLDVKNDLNWVLDAIRNEIARLKPTPNPSKEGKT
jgi:very-short-patch-repair endonuclease